MSKRLKVVLFTLVLLFVFFQIRNSAETERINAQILAFADTEPTNAATAVANPGEGCTSLTAEAPTLRWAQIVADSAMIYTGRGLDYPAHESGVLHPYEKVQVIQECDGWVQGRVIPRNLISTAVTQHGIERATEMLTFWIPADQLN